ncbi:uncharacterized protein B0P05DRAFT_584461 [Gilbertella persicaria]|uniref:uncharacterized protein n=1 Tax=Gilbertella persicaria TaxID=101096 RepID=UPI0022207DD5|nr:uncharacterized protein B0P05DRAFT_584461 [Gilbertella persicaria]KAI8090245.1 hypothetical protein B0P05DRAFT_584461 [Gilbertella persicaria]
MLPYWLSSWYRQQQQQIQLQEPFHDQQYDTEEGEWVEVIAPTTKRRQPQKIIEEQKEEEGEEALVVEKRLSRQERRANARLEIREKKKQARQQAMVSRLVAVK